MYPGPGEVLHFSEDSAIDRFVPHVAATAAQPEPYVWAVNREQAPSYWFPRDCPRAMAWITEGSTAEDRDRILGPGGGHRVHAVEYGWLERIRTARLYAYRLPAEAFRPFGTPLPYAMVAEQPVEPLGPPMPVPGLFDLHAAAGIQLRVLPDLWAFWDGFVAGTLGHSGIRLRNAAPRDATGEPYNCR
jgi:hypothetical protein